VGRIPEAVVQEIRERVDIVDFVARYVSLKSSGRSHKGLCPFHSEKTPSFHVHRDRQIFHCFGCGAGGNVIGFLMKHEGVPFPEAARTLAREAGIRIADDDGPSTDTTARLLAANEAAQSVYREALASPAGAAARAYLADRGLDAATIDHFGIGFAPDRWDAVERALAKAGVPGEIGERAGVLKRRDSGGFYDLLRARVTFPIHDVRGRILGFGGRATKKDQEPKYLNTPETPLFHKREALYGLPFALEASRRRDRLVVVEGYFDLVALHRAGVTECVATCGTALTPEHAKGLRRRVREIVLLFDGDAAGQRAVSSALEVLLPQGLRVRAAELPAGDDPDTFLAREGDAGLRALVDGAQPALDVRIARAVARGVASPWEKADAVAAVAPLLALVRDPVERADFVRRLGLSIGLDGRHVEAAVRAASRGGEAEVAIDAASRPALTGPEARALRTLAQLLLAHPELAHEVERGGVVAGLAPGAWRTMLEALVAAARAGRAEASVLVDGLEGESRALLLELAALDEVVHEFESAARALREIVTWFERRRIAQETRRLRADLHRGEDASGDKLAALQRQLERKKVALGIVSAPSGGH
jgi:DNA primase